MQFPHGQLVLAQAKDNKREYTLKCVSKTKALELGLVASVMQEKTLVSSLFITNRFVPLALATFGTDPASAYLHTLFKTRIATEMDQLIERGHISEDATRFYAAGIISALEHLHQADIVYRNLLPENVNVDIDGYVQLMDLRFAVKLNGPPASDICGLPHYLSPEQVSRRGHSKPVDFWALGILMYEMLSGAAPWITGDPAQDSEVNIYKKITSHELNKMPLPKEELSEDLISLLNDLLDPDDQRRLGVRSVGVEELRNHPWFNAKGFDWDALKMGEMTAPQVDVVTDLLASAEKAGDKALPESGPYTGEQWFAGFDDFLTPRK
jgi:serine/threonine protein kinase